jgi:hypothetical protein
VLAAAVATMGVMGIVVADIRVVAVGMMMMVVVGTEVVVVVVHNGGSGGVWHGGSVQNMMVVITTTTDTTAHDCDSLSLSHHRCNHHRYRVQCRCRDK